jgi:hypothetical protein
VRFDKNWSKHQNAMADAYLRWRYPSPEESSDSASRNHAASAPDDLDITLAVVDLYTIKSHATIKRRDDQHRTIALVEAGYLGNSPEEPTMAISLKTLDLYRVLRQRKPSFSFESFAKVLCDLYQVRESMLCHRKQFTLSSNPCAYAKTPYRRQWRIALADAFDVFLSIRHIVETRIAEALGRLTENWRVLNACPPCMYEVRNTNSSWINRLTIFPAQR